MLPLLLAAALAGEPVPTRCDAVYQGPVDRCGLPDEIAATGHGRSEAQARRAALTRLEVALEAAALVRAAKAADSLASVATRREVDSCPKAGVEAAKVHCLAEPGLVEERLCFASFEDSACWRGPMVDLEGPAWKMMEEGRERICEALDDSLREAAADVQTHQACLARCYQQAKVRCPG